MLCILHDLLFQDIIPFLKLNGDHSGVDVKRNGDHFGVGIISGSIWGSFQGWGSFRGRDHFGGCTYLYGPRKSKQRWKNERTTPTAITCDTFWPESFGTSNSSSPNAKIYVVLYSFCFVLFWICGQFPSISPRGF